MRPKQTIIQNKESKRKFNFQKIRKDSNQFFKRENYLKPQIDGKIIALASCNYQQKNRKGIKSQEPENKLKDQIKMTESFIQEGIKERSLTYSFKDKQSQNTKNTNDSYTKNIQFIQSKVKINKIKNIFQKSNKNNKLIINHQNLFATLNKINDKLEQISQIHIDKIFLGQLQDFYENIASRTNEYNWILRKLFNLIDFCQKRRANYFINQQYNQSQNQKLQLVTQINQKQVKIIKMKQLIQNQQQKIAELSVISPISYVCECKNILTKDFCLESLPEMISLVNLSHISEVNSQNIVSEKEAYQQNQFFKIHSKTSKHQITSSQNQFLQEKAILRREKTFKNAIEKDKQKEILKLNLIQQNKTLTQINKNNSIIKLTFRRVVQETSQYNKYD